MSPTTSATAVAPNRISTPNSLSGAGLGSSAMTVSGGAVRRRWQSPCPPGRRMPQPRRLADPFGLSIRTSRATARAAGHPKSPVPGGEAAGTEEGCGGAAFFLLVGVGLLPEVLPAPVEGGFGLDRAVAVDLHLA